MRDERNQLCESLLLPWRPDGHVVDALGRDMLALAADEDDLVDDDDEAEEEDEDDDDDEVDEDVDDDDDEDEDEDVEDEDIEKA